MSASVLAHTPVEPAAVVTVLVLGAVIALYAAGTVRRAPSRVPSTTTPFAVAIAALLVALVSPLESAAHHRFWAHMVQHLLLTAVAAPALALAAVPRIVSFAVDAPVRLVLHRSLVAGWWRRLSRRGIAAWPLVAAGVHLVALAAWHLPALYDLAVADSVVHLVEHATLLATAVALWVAVVAARTVAPGSAFAALFGTSIASGILGALITFAAAPLYGAYASAATGLTSMEDQQLAGVLMWVPGGLAYLVAAAIILATTLQATARRRRRLDAALHVVLEPGATTS